MYPATLSTNYPPTHLRGRVVAVHDVVMLVRLKAKEAPKLHYLARSPAYRATDIVLRRTTRRTSRARRTRIHIRI